MTTTHTKYDSGRGQASGSRQAGDWQGPGVTHPNGRAQTSPPNPTRQPLASERSDQDHRQPTVSTRLPPPTSYPSTSNENPSTKAPVFILQMSTSELARPTRIEGDSPTLDGPVLDLRRRLVGCLDDCLTREQSASEEVWRHHLHLPTSEVKDLQRRKPLAGSTWHASVWRRSKRPTKICSSQRGSIPFMPAAANGVIQFSPVCKQIAYSGSCQVPGPCGNWLHIENTTTDSYDNQSLYYHVRRPLVGTRLPGSLPVTR